VSYSHFPKASKTGANITIFWLTLIIESYNENILNTKKIAQL